MSTAAIIVENLSKQYHIGHLQHRHDTLRDQLMSGLKELGKRHKQREEDTVWALRDVSFEIQPGEVVGVIGRNGAGKSTLLKILSRITEPTEGRVVITGRVGSLLEVGTGFHPELTGRENIYLNGAILGMRKREIERKFDEIVAFAEIEKFLDTPVKRYSSGMYVRLAFAVAAHLEPEILLVDEVLAVGDAQFQKKCLGKMGEVAREGRTVLFVSHNMGAVRTICNKGILLDSGRIGANGLIDEVVDKYMDSSVDLDVKPVVGFEKPTRHDSWISSAAIQFNGQSKNIMKMGETITITVTFQSIHGIRDPILVLRIFSMQGDRILDANNIYQHSSSVEGPITEGIIRCELGVVPLMEDRYYVSLWFGEENPYENRYQYLERALVFDVVEFDVWGKGKLPFKNVSAMWWPTKFTIEKTGEGE